VTLLTAPQSAAYMSVIILQPPHVTSKIFLHQAMHMPGSLLNVKRYKCSVQKCALSLQMLMPSIRKRNYLKQCLK
jgi:hypothetical protein